MAEIRLKIKGVHYAVHSDYNPKNGDVSTEVLRKICKALNCGLEDIVEIVPDPEPSPENRTDDAVR
jgi:hypothetical protein